MNIKMKKERKHCDYNPKAKGFKGAYKRCVPGIVCGLAKKKEDKMTSIEKEIAKLQYNIKLLREQKKVMAEGVVILNCNEFIDMDDDDGFPDDILEIIDNFKKTFGVNMYPARHIINTLIFSKKELTDEQLEKIDEDIT